MRAQLFLIEHGAQINPPAFNKMLREVGLPTFSQVGISTLVKQSDAFVGQLFLLSNGVKNFRERPLC